MAKAVQTTGEVVDKQPKSIQAFLENVFLRNLGDQGPMALENLLCFCRKLAEKHWPASVVAASEGGSDGYGNQGGWNVRLFIVAELAVRSGLRNIPREVDTDGKHFGKTAQDWLKRAKLLVSAAAKLGLSIDQLADDWVAWTDFKQRISEFELAVAPRHIRSLLASPQFPDRFVVFEANQVCTDQAVMEQARSYLMRVCLLNEEQAGRLLDRIPMPRLRTFSKAVLQNLAENYKLWHKHVDMLEQQSQQSSAYPCSDIEQLRWDLLNKMRPWSHDWAEHSYSPEDAVDDALLYAMRTREDALNRYAYEGDFFYWLFSIAQNKLRAAWREKKKLAPLSDGEGPVATPCVDWRQLPKQMLDWRERFLLTKTFFKGNTARYAQFLFESMLMQSVQEEPKGQTDATLAAHLRLNTDWGKSASANMLPGVRRKLRQRFEALRFVLDEMPEGQVADKPDDASVLDAVARAHGLADKDVPTIRGLACLARASLGTGTLLDALFSRIMVDRTGKAGTALLAELDTQLQARKLADDDITAIQQRRSLGQQWLNYPGNQRRLKSLRGRATTDHQSFLVAPCWCLHVLRGRSVQQTIQDLNVSNTGQAYIQQTIMRQLDTE